MKSLALLLLALLTGFCVGRWMQPPPQLEFSQFKKFYQVTCPWEVKK